LNPRTPIEDLKLAGSPNLKRALKRAEIEANLPAPKNAAEEVAQIDSLIQQCIGACRRGQTVAGRKNPAFQNLAALVKTRKLILERGGIATNKTTDQILAEANALLEIN